VQLEEQKLNRHAPTMLFALLLTLLLGGAGSAAASPAGSAAFKALQGAQVGDVVRSLRRVSDEDPDTDAPAPLWSAAGPSVETLVVSRRPAAQAAAPPSDFRARPRRTPFRARAPPAS
jgi:hypothetical protein